MLAPGEINDFRVAVSGFEHPEKLSYVWGTSLGKIVSGFGSPAIKLFVEKEHQNYNLTVFVRVDGLPENCKNTESDTFAVAPHIIADTFPFGLVDWPMVATIVDTWVVMWESNPTLNPVIIMRFAEKEHDATRLRRLRQLLRALQFRKKISNVSFAIVETPSRTETEPGFQIPGVEFKLEDESFVLIKAADLLKNPKRILGKPVCHCYRKIK